MTVTKRTGGCQCGNLRYEISAEPVNIYVCHCRECQKQSASAFGISFQVSRDSFRLAQGKVQTWSRGSDTGGTIDCHFCPDCGTRLWHETRGTPMVFIKGGSLDEPLDLTNAIHIWTRRKLPGVLIPDGAKQFTGEPE